MADVVGAATGATFSVSLVTRAPAARILPAMAKGIEKDKTQNKPKLSTKEKQKKKKEKKAAR